MKDVLSTSTVPRPPLACYLAEIRRRKMNALFFCFFFVFVFWKVFLILSFSGNRHRSDPKTERCRRNELFQTLLKSLHPKL